VTDYRDYWTTRGDASLINGHVCGPPFAGFDPTVVVICWLNHVTSAIGYVC